MLSGGIVFQSIRGEMWRLRSGNPSERAGSPSQITCLSFEVFHMHGLSEAAVNRWGVVHGRWRQVHLQGRLPRQVPRFDSSRIISSILKVNWYTNVTYSKYIYSTLLAHDECTNFATEYFVIIDKTMMMRNSSARQDLLGTGVHRVHCRSHIQQCESSWRLHSSPIISQHHCSLNCSFIIIYD